MVTCLKTTEKTDEDINLEMTPGERGLWGGGQLLSNTWKAARALVLPLPAAPPSVPELAQVTETLVGSFAPAGGALNLYDGQLYVPTWLGLGMSR